MGKTLLEPRDMSYAVINAIMKMKIAVVATRKRQWSVTVEGEDSLLGDGVQRPSSSEALSEAQQCTFQ